jgi:3-isopropylmalate/(R)-2-methylmalate dehydratase small subunit
VALLFEKFAGSETTVAVDLERDRLIVTGGRRHETVPCALTEFDRALVRAGGWVAYADSRY